jgi:hypothetical protein
MGIGRRLLERKKPSQNRYQNKRRVGGMWHVDVPPTPHPLSVACPACQAHWGKPCRDLRKGIKPFKEREKHFPKNPHKERYTLAKEVHEKYGVSKD